MKSGIHSIIISIFLIFSCTTVMAQEDSEYRMEIGGGVGMMTYEGERSMSVILSSLTSLGHSNIFSSLSAQDMITVGHRDLRLSSVWASVSHTSTAKMAPSISRMQAVFLPEDW